MAKRTERGQIRTHSGFLKADGVKALWPGCAVRVVDAEGASRVVWEVRGATM